MLRLLTLVLAISVLTTSLAFSAPPAETSLAGKGAPAAKAVKATEDTTVTVSRGDITATGPAGSVTLTRAEQRKLGLLPRWKVRREVREIKREGFDGSNEELARELQDRLYENNPEAWEAVAVSKGVKGSSVGVDWEGLLGFLEQLIPIIERILAIFMAFA